MIGTKQLKKKVVEKKPLTRKEAILAHCFDCMGFYQDGYSVPSITKSAAQNYAPLKQFERSVMIVWGSMKMV